MAVPAVRNNFDKIHDTAPLRFSYVLVSGFAGFVLTEGDSCFEYAISKISELTWTWPKFPLYSLGKQVNEIRRERPREANIDLDTTASRAAKFQIRFGTNGFLSSVNSQGCSASSRAVCQAFCTL